MADFEVPSRIAETWLRENCPKLSVGQARELVASLRKRGWRHGVTGSLDERVLARLRPQVRAKLEAERDAS